MRWQQQACEDRESLTQRIDALEKSRDTSESVIRELSKHFKNSFDNVHSRMELLEKTLDAALLAQSESRKTLISLAKQLQLISAKETNQDNLILNFVTSEQELKYDPSDHICNNDSDATYYRSKDLDCFYGAAQELSATPEYIRKTMEKIRNANSKNRSGGVSSVRALIHQFPDDNIPSTKLQVSRIDETELRVVEVLEIEQLSPEVIWQEATTYDDDRIVPIAGLELNHSFSRVVEAELELLRTHKSGPDLESPGSGSLREPNDTKVETHEIENEGTSSSSEQFIVTGSSQMLIEQGEPSAQDELRASNGENDGSKNDQSGAFDTVVVEKQRIEAGEVGGSGAAIMEREGREEISALESEVCAVGGGAGDSSLIAADLLIDKLDGLHQEIADAGAVRSADTSVSIAASQRAAGGTEEGAREVEDLDFNGNSLGFMERIAPADGGTTKALITDRADDAKIEPDSSTPSLHIEDGKFDKATSGMPGDDDYGSNRDSGPRRGSDQVSGGDLLPYTSEGSATSTAAAVTPQLQEESREAESEPESPIMAGKDGREDVTWAPQRHVKDDARQEVRPAAQNELRASNGEVPFRDTASFVAASAGGAREMAEIDRGSAGGGVVNGPMLNGRNEESGPQTGGPQTGGGPETVAVDEVAEDDQASGAIDTVVAEKQRDEAGEDGGAFGAIMEAEGREEISMESGEDRADHEAVMDEHTKAVVGPDCTAAADALKVSVGWAGMEVEGSVFTDAGRGKDTHFATAVEQGQGVASGQQPRKDAADAVVSVASVLDCGQISGGISAAKGTTIECVDASKVGLLPGGCEPSSVGGVSAGVGGLPEETGGTYFPESLIHFNRPCEERCEASASDRCNVESLAGSTREAPRDQRGAEMSIAGEGERENPQQRVSDSQREAAACRDSSSQGEGAGACVPEPCSGTPTSHTRESAHTDAFVVHVDGAILEADLVSMPVDNHWHQLAGHSAQVALLAAPPAELVQDPAGGGGSASMPQVVQCPPGRRPRPGAPEPEAPGAGGASNDTRSDDTPKPALAREGGCVAGDRGAVSPHGAPDQTSGGPVSPARRAGGLRVESGATARDSRWSGGESRATVAPAERTDAECERKQSCPEAGSEAERLGAPTSEDGEALGSVADEGAAVADEVACAVADGPAVEASLRPLPPLLGDPLLVMARQECAGVAAGGAAVAGGEMMQVDSAGEMGKTSPPLLQEDSSARVGEKGGPAAGGAHEGGVPELPPPAARASDGPTLPPTERRGPARAALATDTLATEAPAADSGEEAQICTCSVTWSAPDG